MRGSSILAAGIAGAAVLLCAAYALRYPIFQNPDENNHYDYALTLHTAQRPVRPSEGPGQNDTHPWVRFLIERTGAAGLRINRLARLPEGYGTRAFFDAIDRDAPPLDEQRFRTGPISPVPYLSKAYPLGYYGLVAVALTAGERLGANGLVEQFFAARTLSVLLFIAMLVFSWLLFGELRVPGPQAAVLLAFTAFLPMALQTFAGVQPDDLVAVLIAAVLWLSLLALRRDRPVSVVAIVGLLLAALCATKRHYWLAVAVPVTLAFIAAASARLRLTRAALLLAPSLLAYALTQPFLHDPPGGAALCGPEAAPARSNALAVIADFFDSALLGGQSTQRFWLAFGWHGDPIVVGNRLITDLVLAGVTAGSLAVFFMAVTVAIRNLRRLYRVAKRRSLPLALSLATRNVAFNAYVCYALLLLLILIRLGGGLTLQGRYWLPFLPVIWYAAVVLAPCALPRGWQSATRRVIVAGIAAAIVAGNVFAPASIADRFFREAPDRAARANEEIYTVFETAAGRTQTPPPQSIARGTVLTLRGIVVDLRNAAPAGAIELAVDGAGGVPASSRAVPSFACNNVAISLLGSGFDVRIPTAALAPGTHVAAIRARTPWSHGWVDTGVHAAFEVVP